MNNYFIKFKATGNVEWLEQTTFVEAYNYVLTRYGNSWRNLCDIYTYQHIAA